MFGVFYFAESYFADGFAEGVVPPITDVVGDDHILLGQKLSIGTPFDPSVGGWQP